jgi:hypothetical protein
MQDPKAQALFHQVLQKTKAGRVAWSPTAIDSQFLTVLPGGFTFVISKTEERDSWGSTYEQLTVVLRGEDDAELLQVTPDIGIDRPDFVELYELARRKALGVDAKVDKLIGDLARL